MVGRSAPRLALFAPVAAGTLAGTVLALALVALLSARAPYACPRFGDGKPGAQAQLVALDVSDERVAFTFGLSAAGAFGVPEFDIAVAPDPSSLVVRFRGTSTRNPDGTPSYTGPIALRSERGPVLLLFDGERVMGWLVPRVACPRVVVKTYTVGSTFPRALVVLAFGEAASITLEPPARATGGPVLVSGVGFAPSSEVGIFVAGAETHRATANASGGLETILFVPALPPGRYLVLVTDVRGRNATATLTIP